MKKRIFAVASLLTVGLAIAPVTSAFARDWHHGGHHGGGPIWGLANAVVATAAAIITAPVAIVAAVAQAPLYYAHGPANTYAYDAPPAPRGYYGNPVGPAY